MTGPNNGRLAGGLSGLARMSRSGWRRRWPLSARPWSGLHGGTVEGGAIGGEDRPWANRGEDWGDSTGGCIVHLSNEEQRVHFESWGPFQLA